jgi:hypothetical protein
LAFVHHLLPPLFLSPGRSATARIRLHGCELPQEENVSAPVPPLADASRRLKGRPGRPRSGHSAGIAEAQARINGGPQKGALVESTSAPRLLDLRATAVYLGISEWTVRDLEAAGTLRRVRVPTPSGELRKLLFDREDLDRLIEVWKEA